MTVRGCASRMLASLLPILLWVAPTIIVAQTPASAPPERIDSAEFARLPEFTDAKLSPDGTRVLFRSYRDGETFVGLKSLDRSGVNAFAIPKNVDLNWFRWAGDRRILMSLGTAATIGSGLEVRRTVLMLRDLDTNTTRYVGRRTQGLEGDDVLWVGSDGRSLLLSMQQSLFDYPSVYRVSLDADGKMTEVVGQKDSVWEWYADRSGVVRAGYGVTGNKLRFFYRAADGQPFRQIGSVRTDDELDEGYFDIARIVSGSSEGYVLSDKATGRVALYRFNYETREIGALVYGDDSHDIGDYWLNEDGTKLEGVSFTDDRDRVVWFDPDRKKAQGLIDRALKGQGDVIGRVVSQSRDGRKLLVLGSAPNDPGLYYVLDRDTLEMQILAPVVQSLDPDRLATAKAVRYPARDGRSIPGFLTLPRGREAKELPLIIMPHGGPFGIRDKLEYDGWAQFLANRGYAVLQPNYRGSGGYGTAYQDAGLGQIGRAMQDDLDDGMDWLAGQGTIDPQRVCVVGASYGGYAALWAVSRNPERYRCAASFAGVTDWKAMLRYDNRYLDGKNRRRWRDKVRGEKSFDLDAVSPVRTAAALTRPVLIGQGDADTNVPIDQAKRLVKALKSAGKPYEYKVYEGEGYGFAKEENQKDWLDRLDAFLARHNPA